jgi:hypothetical protein
MRKSADALTRQFRDFFGSLPDSEPQNFAAFSLLFGVDFANARRYDWLVFLAKSG